MKKCWKRLKHKTINSPSSVCHIFTYQHFLQATHLLLQTLLILFVQLLWDSCWEMLNVVSLQIITILLYVESSIKSKIKFKEHTHETYASTRTSMLSFCNNILKICLLQMYQNAPACGKGLNHKDVFWPCCFLLCCDDVHTIWSLFIFSHLV